MAHDFDKAYWEDQWTRPDDAARAAHGDPNPHLVGETAGLAPGTALDAGCGEGTEALWLASAGWQVTAVDIASTALARAAERAAASGLGNRLDIVEADLTTWTPEQPFDLVTTLYAHPTIPQLDFYDRLSRWVAPGGTLLIVGHRHDHGARHGRREHDGHEHDGHEHSGHEGHRSAGHEHRPPATASVTTTDITALLNEDWTIVTAEDRTRTVSLPGARSAQLDDVVVRATRRRTARDVDPTG